MTGFTPSGIVLIQRYIDRTGDIQTATLLASYFPRAHLSSRELATVERWTDAYRSLLDSWLAWIPRCSLDVALLEQRRRIGETVADTIQTVVVCPVCNSQLTKQTEEMLTRKNALRGAIRAPTVRVRFVINIQPANFRQRPACTARMLCRDVRSASCMSHQRLMRKIALTPWGALSCLVKRVVTVVSHSHRVCGLSWLIRLIVLTFVGHVAHILGWFEGGLDGEPAHDICPVAGCDCQCASL